MVIVALLGMTLAWHPLHASSATIVITPGSARGTVSIRVFADDFPPGRDSVRIVRYLRERFSLMQDRKPITLTYEGHRLEGDTQTLELSLAGPTHCSNLEVWHGLLADRFPDQVNLVRVRCGGRMGHLIFSAGEGPKRL
jgi:hypothetical protein